MGARYEYVVQPECKSIWGDRPPSREDREFEERIQEMLAITRKHWGVEEEKEIEAS